MKITRARSWVVKQPARKIDNQLKIKDRGFVFIQVDTDEGVTGWG